MGAELFVQVFNEAKEKLSRELLSPNDSAALLPLKQLKLLYAMLCQVLKGNGETNVHLTDLLDALKMAITNPSANGERELPDTLPLTPGNNPHTSTKNVILDGVEIRIYQECFIVAPNVVNYQVHQLQHATDWVNLISDMSRRD